jgi:hypothetical protein
MSKGGIVNPEDNTEYRDVIKTLNQLQEVKARKGFEADLMRRINSEEADVPEISSRGLFDLSRLVPAAALAVTAVLLIFVLDHTGITPDNPLNTAPRERQEVTAYTQKDNISQERKTLKTEGNASQQDIAGIQKDKVNETESKPAVKSEQNLKRPGTLSDESTAGKKTGGGQFITAKFNSDRITNYPVSKAGLNFRQVNLSNKQKKQLDQMKEKLETMFNTRGKQ